MLRRAPSSSGNAPSCGGGVGQRRLRLIGQGAFRGEPHAQPTCLLNLAGFGLAAGLALLLTGCGSANQAEAPPPPDPVMAAALQQPLLTDPDLSATNAHNLAIVPPGPAIPPQPLPKP